MNLTTVIAERPTKKIYVDKDKVIKLFDENFSKSDVLNEALNQARVEEIGVNAPHIHEVTKINGKWAIVMDYVPGKTMAQLMAENPQDLDKYLERFVEIQMHIHTFRCPLLNKLKDKMDRKIDQTTLDSATKYELHTRLQGMMPRAKLCHGDFNPANVIITPSGEEFVIDWSHATQGNAGADVARTYLVFVLAGKKEFADRYVDLFCERSGLLRKYINYWLPIVAASQSVKGKPEEVDILKEWASVVEFN